MGKYSLLHEMLREKKVETRWSKASGRSKGVLMGKYSPPYEILKAKGMRAVEYSKVQATKPTNLMRRSWKVELSST